MDKEALEKKRERAREELQHEREEAEAEPSAAQQTGDALDAIAEKGKPLQRGPTLDSPVGPIPRRALLALAVFLAVAVATYLLIWTLLGGLGLAVGWIPAAALGLYAAREHARRGAAEDRPVGPGGS